MLTKRIATAVLVLAALGVSACAPYTLPARPPNPTKAPTDGQITLSDYACESGARIRASYPTSDDAVVQYRGETRRMRSARSADAARYVNDALEWWTRGKGPGAEATLFEHTSDGRTGEIIERCREVTS